MSSLSLSMPEAPPALKATVAPLSDAVPLRTAARRCGLKGPGEPRALPARPSARMDSWVGLAGQWVGLPVLATLAELSAEQRLRMERGLMAAAALILIRGQDNASPTS